jgi:hypothetical protein
MVRTAQASSSGVAAGYGGWMCCPYKTSLQMSASVSGKKISVINNYLT